ncbi:MAG: hypothetical protein II126_01760 [Erysipelotrichaceae bacterium]|nr:hypothetical protein [Erysipelotrichaceae bacterium]
MKYLLIIIPIVALILLIGVIWWNQVLTIRIPKDYSPPQDTVSYVSYSRSGDMNGSMLNMSIRRISDSQALISFSYRKAANKSRRDYSRRIPADVLDRITETVGEHGMAEWVDLPKKDTFVLDEAAQTLRYRINSTNYVLSSISQMPDEGEGFRQIRAILMQLATITFKL